VREPHGGRGTAGRRPVLAEARGGGAGPARGVETLTFLRGRTARGVGAGAAEGAGGVVVTRRRASGAAAPVLAEAANGDDSAVVYRRCRVVTGTGAARGRAYGSGRCPLSPLLPSPPAPVAPVAYGPLAAVPATVRARRRGRRMAPDRRPRNITGRPAAGPHRPFRRRTVPLYAGVAG
jgi:hypothetical protein